MLSFEFGLILAYLFLSMILAYLTKECVNSALTIISFFLYKLEANLKKQVLKSGE